jgi:GAF domain-containing protein
MKLQDVLAELERQPDRPRMLGAACRGLTRLLDAQACAVSRVVGTALIDLAEYAVNGRSLHVGHGYLIPDYPVTQEVVQLLEPRTVSLREPDSDSAEVAFLREVGYGSLLMLPLQVAGECWGLVEVLDEAERHFGDEDAGAAEPVLQRLGELLAG